MKHGRSSMKKKFVCWFDKFYLTRRSLLGDWNFYWGVSSMVWCLEIYWVHSIFCFVTRFFNRIDTKSYLLFKFYINRWGIILSKYYFTSQILLKDYWERLKFPPPLMKLDMYFEIVQVFPSLITSGMLDYRSNWPLIC